MTKPDFAPDQAYGALAEGVHVAGYTLERAFRKLEWLLEADRWRSVGSGFEDINAFLDTIKLDSFKIVAEQRKDLARQIKQLQPEASNVRIAKVLGVDEKTVRKDMASDNSEAGCKKPNDNNARETSASENSEPNDLSGAEAARAVERAEAEATSKWAFGSSLIAAPQVERGLDLYETPPVATRALLAVEPLDGTIWEPACGPGSIVRVLRAAGHRVIATDIEDYGCADSLGGVDFLKQARAPSDANLIVTNPPYSRAAEFVRQALKLVPRVIMLLRLVFLESEGRADILESAGLARVHVFRNRLPMMHRAGWAGPKIDTSMVAMAWFVWERDHHGPPTLHFVSWREEEAAPGDEAPPPAASPDPDPLAIPPFLRRTAS